LEKGEPYFRVESLLAAGRVTFDVLRARLIQQVKMRINNGEFTERGLARLLGISQSQTHNVLKGARKLQMHLADRILMKLGLSAVDLLNDGELDEALRRKMTDWDREMAAAPENDLANTELALEELFAIKRPAGRSETSSGLDVRKTG
jgi:plasmid maintenance system antidote protein VapI